MSMSYTLRLARAEDQAAVDDLLQRSYPALLRTNYSADVMQSVVPLIARARPELLASGRYFLMLDGDRAVGAGGYSLAAHRGRAVERWGNPSRGWPMSAMWRRTPRWSGTVLADD